MGRTALIRVTGVAHRWHRRILPHRPRQPAYACVTILLFDFGRAPPVEKALVAIGLSSIRCARGDAASRAMTGPGFLLLARVSARRWRDSLVWTRGADSRWRVRLTGGRSSESAWGFRFSSPRRRIAWSGALGSWRTGATFRFGRGGSADRMERGRAVYDHRVRSTPSGRRRMPTLSTPSIPGGRSVASRRGRSRIIRIGCFARPAPGRSFHLRSPDADLALLPRRRVIAIPAIDLEERLCGFARREREDRHGYPMDREAVARPRGERIHVVNLGARSTKGRENRGRTRSFEASSGRGRWRSATRRASRGCSTSGAAYVVLGTLALRDATAAKADLRAAAHRIYLGLDEGRLSAQGWTDEGRPWREVLASWRGLGARGVIATAVARDGALLGPDLAFLDEVRAVAGELRVVASGGIGTLADLTALRASGSPIFEGVILGKSLYENRFTLIQARAVLATSGRATSGLAE